MDTLADRIRIGMTFAGLLQRPEVLARAIGISHQHASRLLSGKCRTSNYALLNKMAAKFHVSLHWLAEGNGSPTPPEQLTPNESRLVALYRSAKRDAREAALDLLSGRNSPLTRP